MRRKCEAINVLITNTGARMFGDYRREFSYLEVLIELTIIFSLRNQVDLFLVARTGSSLKLIEPSVAKYK